MSDTEDTAAEDIIVLGEYDITPAVFSMSPDGDVHDLLVRFPPRTKFTLSLGGKTMFEGETR